MRATLARTGRYRSSQRLDDTPGPGSGCPIEEIAQAYLTATQGDADVALRCVITDALSDLLEAERRARENSRLISKGYVRDWPGRV